MTMVYFKSYIKNKAYYKQSMITLQGIAIIAYSHELFDLLWSLGIYVVSIEFSPLSSVALTNSWYQLHNGDYTGILDCTLGAITCS